MTRRKKIQKNLYRHARRGEFFHKAILYPSEIECLKKLGLSIYNIRFIPHERKYSVIVDWSCPCSELTQELFDIAVDNS